MNDADRILVVDDEPDLCEILRFNLESEGFEVDCAHSAESALALIGEQPGFRLILLDVMMERMSGYEMARQLRDSGNDTPIIFLTALGAENNVLDGFSAGGDDYIAKPFSFPTVLARIRAVLKRVPATDRAIAATGLQLDTQHNKLFLDGTPLLLTKKEYLILELLMSKPGKTHSREEIMQRVWEDVYVGDRSVDVHIARLRKKLGSASTHIVNHSGFGYAFEP